MNLRISREIGSVVRGVFLAFSLILGAISCETFFAIDRLLHGGQLLPGARAGNDMPAGLVLIYLFILVAGCASLSILVLSYGVLRFDQLWEVDGTKIVCNSILFGMKRRKEWSFHDCLRLDVKKKVGIRDYWLVHIVLKGGARLKLPLIHDEQMVSGLERAFEDDMRARS